MLKGYLILVLIVLMTLGNGYAQSELKPVQSRTVECLSKCYFEKTDPYSNKKTYSFCRTFEPFFSECRSLPWWYYYKPIGPPKPPPLWSAYGEYRLSSAFFSTWDEVPYTQFKRGLPVQSLSFNSVYYLEHNSITN